MSTSTSKPTWFDLGNYDAITHDQAGLEQLAKLLYTRPKLFAEGVSAKSNRKYQQIFAAAII
jgi:hypothetical protein